MNTQNRPQSALFRQQIPFNISTNENTYFGEDCLLGYQPSTSECGEWADEPIVMYLEEKPRPKLDLGLKGNPVSYSPRSKIRIPKNIHKLEPEPNLDSYRFIPDLNKEYQLQEHSLHPIRPENLLGKQSKRRTMDFVLIGQKKEFKTNEEIENSLKRKTFQTLDIVSKKEIIKPQKRKIPKSETLQSLNLNRIDLKIEQDTKNSIDSPRQISLIIPLPSLPQM